MSRQKEFEPRLRRASRARYRRIVAEGTVRWLAWCVPGLVILFLVGLLLPPTRLWSGVMAAAAAAWIGAATLVFLFRALARLPRLNGYALWLEERGGLKRNELINALQLERDAARWQPDEVSRELVGRSLRRAGDVISSLNLAQLHRECAIPPRLGLALLALMPLLILWLAAPLRFGDTTRLFLCAGGPAVVPIVELTVSPGDLKVERGSSVTIEATVEGRRRPGNARLEMRRPDGVWNQADMVRGEASGDAQDSYQFLASNLGGDLEYRVRAGWATSESHRIRVLERLQALGYRKQYDPPSYTGLPLQREVSSTGDIAALFGTETTLEVRHRRAGAGGRLRFLPLNDTRPLAADGRGQLRASWTIHESADYLVELFDREEGDTWASDTFHVEVVPDLAPAIRLLEPRQNIKLPADMRVTLVIDCVDDFGITELALIYGRPGDDPQRVELARWDDRKEARLTYHWNMEEVALLPDQELHYFLQLYDNDPLNGPKMAETEVFSVRFPSMAELYTDAEQGREREIGSLEEALQVQENLQEELKQVAQEMLREEEISWEKHQEISDLLEQQKSLAEKVNDIQQSLDNSRQRMENQNLFSMEMIEKVEQIQDLVGQIQSEEFRELLSEMNQALRNMDQAKLQQAMEQMKITQEEISQSLDRTLQMLKQLLAEEKIDRIMQEMQQLQAMQEAINRQLEGDQRKLGAQEDQKEGEDKTGQEDAPPDSLASAGQCPLSKEESEELARQQEAVREQLEKLQKELEQLTKECKKDLEKMAEALKEMMEQSAQEETPEQMQQAQEAMEKQDRDSALKFGRKAKEGLQQMMASMQKLQTDIDLEAAERLARALYNLANRMVQASLRQEQLVRLADQAGPRELAVAEQQLVEELSALGDSLFQISKQTAVVNRGHLRAMGEAYQKVLDTRNLFESGRRAPALKRAQESTLAINSAVKKLVEAAGEMSSQCSSNCPNPFNRMQSLTNQQCQLNQQTQQMMQGMQAQRPTLSQQESLMRMAGRQQMIQQGLEDLQGELKESGKMMGDLGDAIEEMEEVVKELRNRNVDQRIIERQERILNRMLSAQRSVRKRDQSEERLSRAGISPLDRNGPDVIDMGRSHSEILQRAMLRGAKDPVPAEYRGLVETYMRSLLRGTTR